MSKVYDGTLNNIIKANGQDLVASSYFLLLRLVSTFETGHLRENVY